MKNQNEIENLVGKIVAYEEGGMSNSEYVAFFQELVNTGLAWKLQGHYGRTANLLIEEGELSPPEDTAPWS